VVDLLERRSELSRAIEQLDEWAESAPSEYRADLGLRAGLLEVASARPEHAKQRFERLVERDPSLSDAWCELAELTLELDGTEAALEMVARARENSAGAAATARLVWVEACASERLGRRADAARLAAETLNAQPDHLDAARLLAQRLGQSRDFASAVRKLERALDSAEAPTHIEAELAEAIGRSYAGPLEDIERAQRAFRRALACNPDRTSVRESLADITSFDPSAHGESVQLHRALLEGYPGRLRSWEALLRIAEQWHQAAVASTCRQVLLLLGREVDGAPGDAQAAPLVVGADPSDDERFAAATDVLCALNEGEALPPFEIDTRLAQLPPPLRSELVGLAGSGALADDTGLRSILAAARDPEESDLTRRTRRRLRRALRSADDSLLHDFVASEWRTELLVRAASAALGSGSITLEAAARGLLDTCDATADLRFEDSTEPGAVLQLCPAARALLLRLADACAEALGLTA
jgi:tetratricopeptide (TPR) repeat protein